MKLMLYLLSDVCKGAWGTCSLPHKHVVLLVVDGFAADHEQRKKLLEGLRPSKPPT
jgi:hypothetical protein